MATTTVNAGTVNFNSTRPNGTLVLPAGSTGTVIVGAASGGLLPTVSTADFSATPAADPGTGAPRSMPPTRWPSPARSSCPAA